MMKLLIATALLLGTGLVANAASNPTYIAGGGFGPFPVYVNVTGTNQTMAHGLYVNQTQYTPPTPSPNKLLFMPTP